MQPRIGDLVVAIREVLPSLPTRVMGRGLNIGWPRPPLINHEKLRGVPLSIYATFGVMKDFSQLRGIFEEYVARFIADNGEKHYRFFKEYLGIHERNAEWLFPKHIDDPLHHLAVLMWITSNSVVGSVLTADYGTCMVEFEGVKIGVEDCKVLSKFSPGTVESFDYGQALAHHHESGHAVLSSRSSLSAFYRQTALVENNEERELVRQALQYLYFRYEHLGRLTNYLYDGVTPRNKVGLNRRDAAKQADALLMEVPNPMPDIYRILVTAGVIDDEDFVDLFHNDTVYRHQPKELLVDTAALLRWHKTLRQLGNLS